MSWKDTIKELGGAELAFLSTDGEVISGLIVGDPIVLKGKYKGKDQIRIGCPMVTSEGFQLLVTGKRVARKLSKVEGQFKTHAVQIVRHGDEGDINSTYAVSLIDDKETVKTLRTLAKSEFTRESLSDAIDQAKECMDQ